MRKIKAAATIWAAALTLVNKLAVTATVNPGLWFHKRQAANRDVAKANAAGSVDCAIAVDCGNYFNVMMAPDCGCTDMCVGAWELEPV